MWLLRRDTKVISTAAIFALAMLLQRGLWGADEVSRKPPAVYLEHIVPLLTPLKTAMEARGSAGEEEDGTVLLDEEIQWVTAEGRRLVVDHTVEYARNEAGAAALAESSKYYKKTIATPHVAVARTILPDGRKLEVDSKGTLLHSPQPDADMALYGDTGELRIVFPGVKPGCVVESVVVIDESELSISGEFMADASWGWRWPRPVRRLVLDLPEAMASRVRVTAVGMGEPAVKKTPSGAGRTRLEWKGHDLPGFNLEPDQPAWTQTGPMLAITTLADWSGVTRWFGHLAEERSALPAAAAKEIDDGEKNTAPPVGKERRAILDALFKKVADEVRYTGLEFGLGAYQPREPAQVWGTRYGDCKDKSNLLRVVLASHGIRSWLALVNTRHDGAVPIQCPTIHRFGHVVLAVDDGQGGLIWCDPTMTHASPGMLASAVADREVLLVKDGGAEWVHTPPAVSDLITYEGELKPKAEGGWSGWLRMTGEGLSGISFNTYFEKSDRPRALAILRSISEGLVPHADLLDYAKEEPPAGATSAVKMFIDVPGVPGRAPEARAPLTRWQESFTRLNHRRTEFFQQLEKRRIVLRYLFPKGHTAPALPAPVDFASPCFKATGHWAAEDGALTATLFWETLATVVKPEVYPECHASAQTLSAWADKILEFRPDGAPSAGTVAEDDLPVMPTGDGQLALINRRYPYGGNIPLRRSALARVADLFPKDASAVFSAEASMAQLDVLEKNYGAAASRIKEAMQHLGARVSADQMAWARQQLAVAYKMDGKEKEALAQVDKIFSDKEVTQERRAWAGIMMADMCGGKEPARAVAALRQCVAWKTQSQPNAFNHLTAALAEHGTKKEIRQVIQEIFGQGAAQLQAASARLADGVDELTEKGKATAAVRWLDALEGATPEAAKPLLAAAMAGARAQIHASDSGTAIRQRLARELEGGAVPGWEQLEPGYPADTARETTSSFYQLAESGRMQEALRYGLRRLTKFDPDQRTPDVLLRTVSCAFEAQWRQAGGAKIFATLVDLCGLLPKSHPGYVDGKMWQAMGKMSSTPAEAEQILKEILASSELSHQQQLRGNSLLGLVYQHLGREEDALRVYEGLTPYIQDDYHGFEGAVHAIVLYAWQGKYVKACELAGKLEKPFEKYKKFTESSDMIRSVLDLASNPEEAAAYWDSAKVWWREWEAFEKEVGVDTSHLMAVPVLGSPKILSQSVGYSFGRRDFKGGMQTAAMMARAARVCPLWEEMMVGMIPVVKQIEKSGLKELFKEHGGRLVETLNAIGLKSRLPKALIADHASLVVWSLETEERYRESCDEARKYWPQMKVASKEAAVLARQWADAAARGKDATDKSEAMKALTATLLCEGNPHGKMRAASLLVLSFLWTEGKTMDEGIKLVERELERTEVKDSPEASKLRDRIKDLAGFRGSDPDQVITAIKEWVAAQPRLGWLEYAEPKEVSEAEVKATAYDSKAGVPLKKGAGSFGRAFDTSAVKRAYLVMIHPSANSQNRMGAFNSGALAMLSISRMVGRDISGWLHQALADERIPITNRGVIMISALNPYAANSDTPVLKRLMSEPPADWICQRINPAFRPQWERFALANECDVQSLEAVQDTAAKLASAKEDMRLLMTPWDRLLTRVIVSGSVESARWMVEHPGASRLAGNQTDDSLRQMALLRFKQDFARKRQWSSKLLKLVETALGRDPATLRCPEFIGGGSNADLVLIEPRKMLEAWGWMLEREDYGGDFFQQGAPYFLDYGRYHLWPGNVDAMLTAAEAALAPAKTDRELAARISEIGPSMVDWSDEEQHRKAMHFLEGKLEAGLYPKSESAIRDLERDTRFRLGKATEQDRRGLDTAGKLSQALADGDTASVRSIINRGTSGDLLGPDMVSLTLRAYRLCGMEEEARIASQKVRKMLNDAVVDSWANLDIDSIYTVLDLWNAVDELDAVPARWIEAMKACIQAPYLRGIILTRGAAQLHDWPEALKQADLLLKAVPIATSCQYERGCALMHLQRKAEARASLEVFVSGHADDPKAGQARAWLRELGS